MFSKLLCKCKMFWCFKSAPKIALRSHHSQENTCARVTFLIKLQALSLQLFVRTRFPLNTSVGCFYYSRTLTFQQKLSSGLMQFLANEHPLKKCLLFHLKGSLRSQDIYIFVFNFWSYIKNGLIRKIRSVSKFMSS